MDMMAEKGSTIDQANLIDDVDDHLKEIAALGLAVDAIGVWGEHSGCEIPSEELIRIGMLIRHRALEAGKMLDKWINRGKGAASDEGAGSP